MIPTLHLGRWRPDDIGGPGPQQCEASPAPSGPASGLALVFAGLFVAIPIGVRRHHLKAEERHAIEASRFYEKLLRSPEYVEQQRLNAMWNHRDTVSITEPLSKFEMGYSMKLTAEYNRRYGNKVKYHNAQSAGHRRAASRPWILTWLD
ncbi:hypothetical protein V5E97_40115 (plasmid) [Singulisphaera sp. Ch08]|uniref:Uncharacterized protein n=1 Tax=Singulisphaera sp. Ch08 TaxID=3120278 RepID=A0AAU7CTQ9_9BACT